jgi:STE24 endopeptidase
MQIVVIGAFVTALALLEASVDAAGAWAAGPAVAGYVLVASSLSGANTALSLRALSRRAGAAQQTVRGHNAMTTLTRFWLIAGLAGTVVLGLGPAVRRAGLMGVPLAAELAVLAPFAVALLLTWVMEYPFHRAVRQRLAWRQAVSGQAPRPVWTLGQYLDFNVRHHLLFVAVPVGLILLASDVLDLYVAPLAGAAAPAVALGGTAGAAALVFFLAPVLLVHVWRTGRLADGPLRRDLEQLCRRLKLRTRDIRVWYSDGVLANAGVMGLAGPVRYVLLSDALLEEMDDEQIKVIFAHEAGHIVFHHIFYAVLFALGSVLLCAAGTDLALRAAGVDPTGAGQLWVLVVLALAWAVGFGWISRRFERQSDVMAAWLAGQSAAATDAGDDRVTPEGAAVFARALEKVAMLNGTPLRQRNWRHGSISRRVAYVMWLGSTGRGRREADRAVRRIKLGLWLLLVLAAVLTAVDGALATGAT